MHATIWTRTLIFTSALALAACGGTETTGSGTTSDASGDQDATSSTSDGITVQDSTSSPGDEVTGQDSTSSPGEDVDNHDSTSSPGDASPGEDISVEEPDEDWDGDGLTNLQEAHIGSDPNNPDTDGDGLSDLEEFDIGSSVFAADTDVDGLSDLEEVEAGTNPTRSDSDGDGFRDNPELQAGSDPLDRRSWPFGGTDWPDMTPFGETSYGTGWAQGNKVPAVSFIDQFGEEIALAQFHGYVVLLDFSAGWCQPCRETAETAEAFWTTYRDEGFMIIHLLTEGNQPGVATTQGLQNEWKIQYGLNFPVVREVDGGTVYADFSQKSGMYPGSIPFLVLLTRDMVIDSGYGAGQEAAIEARLQQMLQAPVPTLPAATGHPIPEDPAAICDADGDDHKHRTCGGADCDDTDAGIQPDTEELCDLVDWNCDGWLHKNAVDTQTFHADVDGDGYGDPEYTVGICEPMWPYVDNGEDCDDTDASLNPETLWYVDMDNDGLGNPDESLQACEQPDGYVDNDQDSDDDDGTSLGCWTHVTVGRDHSCGLKNDGSIVCWGSDADGQAAGPSLPGPFIAVDAGYKHTCALTADGAVDCWGAGAAVAAPPGTFTTLECGLSFCCGLTGDVGDNVSCWGDNSQGQVDAPAGTFAQVSARGGRHACALDADGVMTCWGTEDGFQGAPSPTAVVEGQYGAVSAAHYFTLGIRSDGTIVGWGTDAHEQVTGSSGMFVAVQGATVHSCGLRADGTLSCWGSDSFGRTNSPDGEYTQLDVNQLHSCAVGVDGLVSCWGYDEFEKTTAPPCSE